MKTTLSGVLAILAVVVLTLTALGQDVAFGVVPDTVSTNQVELAVGGAVGRFASGSSLLRPALDAVAKRIEEQETWTSQALIECLSPLGTLSIQDHQAVINSRPHVVEVWVAGLRIDLEQPAYLRAVVAGLRRGLTH